MRATFEAGARDGTVANEALAEIGRRHGFGVAATRAMLDALRRGGGRMAQFAHAEFAGSGQWMAGGMTMVGDMFNHSLKARVDALCNDLAPMADAESERAGSAAREGDAAPGPTGSARSGGRSGPDGDWPAGYGRPSSSGAQNGMRYAYFADARRLVVERGGERSVYDTLDHRIGGVSQQQGGGQRLAFGSQHGSVDVANLPKLGAEIAVDAADAAGGGEGVGAASLRHGLEPLGHDPSEPPVPMAVTASSGASAAAPSGMHAADPLELLEKLAALRDAGVIDAADFAAKKAELLARV